VTTAITSQITLEVRLQPCRRCATEVAHP